MKSEFQIQYTASAAAAASAADASVFQFSRSGRAASVNGTSAMATAKYVGGYICPKAIWPIAQNSNRLRMTGLRLLVKMAKGNKHAASAGKLLVHQTW
ncbi:hypothetical protein D3C87_1165840 [compost metagenome]